MYTTEHNINSLQDLVEHIYKISEIEVSIGDDSFVTLAIKESELFNDFYCLKDEKISTHCYEFWNKATIAALKGKEFDDRCWAGIRLTTKKMNINDKAYFIMFDRFTLSTDKRGIDFPLVKQVGATENDVKAIYSKTPVQTKERVEELFNLTEQCLYELAERGILTDGNEILVSDK